MNMHEKIELLYDGIMEACEKAGVTIIVDRMYVIDRETGNTTTMQIMQNEGSQRKRSPS